MNPPIRTDTPLHSCTHRRRGSDKTREQNKNKKMKGKKILKDEIGKKKNRGSL